MCRGEILVRRQWRPSDSAINDTSGLNGKRNSLQVQFNGPALNGSTTPSVVHEEVSADYTDLIYAETAKDVQSRRRAFLRKWRLRCPAVAASLEEAGDRLFAFVRLPSSQWKSPPGPLVLWQDPDGDLP